MSFPPDPAGTEAGWGGPGMAWLNIVSGSEASWKYCLILLQFQGSVWALFIQIDSCGCLIRLIQCIWEVFRPIDLKKHYFTTFFLKLIKYMFFPHQSTHNSP